MASIEVRNNPDRGRYVVTVDGVEAGYTVYRIRAGNTYFFVHTEIHDGFLGSGAGKVLVREALDHVRAKGGLVVPICPFVWALMNEEPEYLDLVDHEVFDRIADKLHS